MIRSAAKWRLATLTDWVEAEMQANTRLRPRIKDRDANDLVTMRYSMHRKSEMWRKDEGKKSEARGKNEGAGVLLMLALIVEGGSFI